MENTELRQIRHVVTLGRLLSFTRAADELGITQSALTRSIQSLERRAKANLFDRDRGRVRLTEVGRIYLARASRLLGEAEELDHLLHQAAAAEVGEVVFGITPLFARALLPRVLTNELTTRPQLRSTVMIRAVSNLLKLVETEEIEFCICAERPVPPSTLRAIFIGNVDLSLLVRADHPLILDPDRHKLERFPLVTSGQMESEGIMATVRHYFTGLPQIMVDDFGILANITAGSDAIWLSSADAAVNELKSGQLKVLHVLGGEPLGSMKVTMYSSSRRVLSPVARSFVELLREEMHRLRLNRSCE